MNRYRSYFANILMLLRGTVMAQLIPVLTAPLISRMFSPAQFGVYYAFSACVSILLIVITARYDQAIVLPEKDHDAVNILVLTLLLVTFLSACLLPVLLCFEAGIDRWIGDEQAGRWFLFLPLSLLLNGWFLAFYNWCVRKKSFRAVAASKIIESLTNNGVKVGGGVQQAGVPALIAATIISQAAMLTAVAISARKSLRGLFSYITLPAIGHQAKSYSHFPLYFLWGNLFNVLAFMLPALLLPHYVDTATNGYFGFMQRIFQLPLAAIALAAGEVFRQQSVEEIRQQGHCRTLFLATMRPLLLMAVVPFSIVLLFGEQIFSSIFGIAWGPSGLLAQLFAVPYFILFVSSPFLSLFQTTGNSKTYLLFQALLCMMVAGSFLLARASSASHDLMLMLAASYSIIFMLLGAKSYQLACRKPAEPDV